MPSPGGQQALQFVLLGVAEAGEHRLQLGIMAEQNTLDQLTTRTRELDLLAPGVVRRPMTHDQLGPCQPVDQACSAGRTNQQAVAELTGREGGIARLFGSIERAKDAPFGTADAEAAEVGLHDTFKQPEGAYEFDKRV